MSARTSALRHDADQRMFDHVRAALTQRDLVTDEPIVAEYLREMNRSRWSLALMAECLGTTVGRVRGIRQRDLVRRGYA